MSPRPARREEGAPAEERGVTSWGRLPLAVVTFLGWTAVGLLQVVPDYIVDFHWIAVLGKLIEAWIWVLLTPLILLINRKLGAVLTSVTSLCVAHLLLSIPFAGLGTLLRGLFFLPFPQIYWNPLKNVAYLTYSLWGSWWTYCAYAALLQAFRFQNGFLTSQLELERVKRGLVESRLNALRLQLEPHFLFNALNAISSQVMKNPPLVLEMIEDLGMLLRRSIESHGSSRITLGQEMALLDRYLAIQKRRFGKRIDFRIDVEPSALSATVPSLLLQPLVENAIRHGIEGRPSGGMVTISARVTGEELRIDVIDDGVGLPPHWRMEACSGLGLRVTRERLEALYSPANDRFVISPGEGRGTAVVIRIPRMTGSADEAEA